jgi:hypothetical protein
MSPAPGKSLADFDTDADCLAWIRSNPNAPITCVRRGEGCDQCGDEGTVPAWVLDPEITGYPHERLGR